MSAPTKVYPIEPRQLDNVLRMAAGAGSGSSSIQQLRLGTKKICKKLLSRCIASGDQCYIRVLTSKNDDAKCSGRLRPQTNRVVPGRGNLLHGLRRSLRGGGIGPGRR